MKVSAFITITHPEKRGDLFNECYQAATSFADEIVIVDGARTWPREFDWKVIGQHFQRGYEEAAGDWVVHLDTDFIIHENDAFALRKAINLNISAPALSLWKYQFVLPDRYNLKSRLVLAVNKAKYGSRIRFDSGGDLCQPSLDGRELTADDVPEARIPFYNYDKLIKNQDQIRDDVGRMARAWQRHFGEYKLGGPDDESAYQVWLEMTLGRFNGRSHEEIPLEAHPKVVQETIAKLKPHQWGYNGFGNLPRNNYV